MKPHTLLLLLLIGCTRQPALPPAMTGPVPYTNLNTPADGPAARKARKTPPVPTIESLTASLNAMRPAVVIVLGGPMNAAQSNFWSRAQAACPGLTTTNYSLSGISLAWSQRCPDSYYANAFRSNVTLIVYGKPALLPGEIDVPLVIQRSYDLTNWFYDGVMTNPSGVYIATNDPQHASSFRAMSAVTNLHLLFP